MKAQSLESIHVNNRQDESYRELQKLYKEIALLRATACRKLLLSQSQWIFEQGERTSRLLAWLAREGSTTSHIANIRDGHGALYSDPTQINSQFAQFYKTLYTSKLNYTPEIIPQRIYIPFWIL